MAVDKEDTSTLDMLGDEEENVIDLPSIEDTDEFEIVIADEEPAEVAVVEVEENPVETPEPVVEETDPDEEEDPDMDPETVEMRKHLRPKFRKRLDREMRAKREAQGIAVQAANYARSKDAEITTMRGEMTKLQLQYAETLESAIGDRLSMRTAELKQARAEGNFDTETQLMADVDDLRYKLNQVKDAKRNLGEVPPAAAATPATPVTPAAATPETPAAPPMAPRAKKWIADNGLWFNNKTFAAERAAVLAIDREISAEGYSANTKEYYEELDKRVDAKFPTLRKKAPTTVKSPVAPVTTGVTTPAASGKNRVTLTRDDLANMQRFGLDPSNKAHLQEFVRQKRASA